MNKFNRYSSYKKLQKLAKDPFDLQKLTPLRMQKMTVQSGSFLFSYAMERVTEEVIDQLFYLSEESGAMKKMRDMQEGKVVNFIHHYPSEERAVLHTAVRDLFEDQIQTEAVEEIRKKTEVEIDKLKKFLQDADSRYTTLIHVGIGGSDLGPKALYKALKAYQKNEKKIYFVSNVDPDDAASVLKETDLSKTLIVSVSKSGTTLETLTNEERFRKELIQKGLNPKDHIVAVTKENSPMDDPSKYLASFYIWDLIGGRYSSTSMVGAVTLSFAFGMNGFMQILKGASKMDKKALKNDKTNLPLLAALLGIWNRNFLGYDALALIPYSDALSLFPAHIQQCDMESNGKQIDKEGDFISYSTGPIIFGEPGTNGQHSFFQFLHQGKTIVPIEFIGFKHSQYKDNFSYEKSTSQQKLLANLFAQSIAFAVGKENENPNKTFLGNRPNHLLLANQLDFETMGALLSFYEHKIAFQGFIWGINSFDQEGVQLGKNLANRLLKQMKGEKTDFDLGNQALGYLDQL